MTVTPESGTLALVGLGLLLFGLLLRGHVLRKALRKSMKPIAFLIFLALAIPAWSRPHPLHWAKTHKLQIAADLLVAGASAIDVASTRSALAQGNHEANPLYGPHPSLARLLAIKIALDLPVAAGNNLLDQRTRGASRWRRLEILIPALILSGPEIWAAHHNWTLGKAR